MGWLALASGLLGLALGLTSILLRRTDSRTIGRLEERVRWLESRALKLTNALARARQPDPSLRELDELYADSRPDDS